MVKKISIGNSVNRGMFLVEDSLTVRAAFSTNGISIEGNVTADGVVLTPSQIDDTVASLGDVSYLRSVPAKQDAYSIKVFRSHAVVISEVPYSDWKEIGMYVDPEEDVKKKLNAIISVGEFPSISEYGITFSENKDDVADVEFTVTGDTMEKIKREIFDKYGVALKVLEMAETAAPEIIAAKAADRASVTEKITIA